MHLKVWSKGLNLDLLLHWNFIGLNLILDVTLGFKLSVLG